MTRLARLLFAICLLSAPLVAAAQTGGIAGRVTDGRSGAPVPGAQVVVTSLEVGTTTGDQGRFELPGVPAGRHRVEIRMLGYEKAVRDDVRVPAGGTATVDVVLQETSLEMSEVVVRATRISTPLSAVSGSITVVDARDLRAQETVGDGLGDALAHLVPGLGVSTGSPSSYGQSLRGRAISVMIDGIPQSTTRNTSRDLATIDPAMIERVEVIRGATAIYGDGATGGIINIITRRPPTLRPRYTTDVSAGGSVSAPGSGLQGRILQTASGRTGRVDYRLGGSLARTTGFYDAEGDLIPPDPYGQGGLASTESWDVNGSLGYAQGAHRLEAVLNAYRSRQETAFVTDPSVDTLPPGETKARAMEGLRLDEDQETRNTVASLDYRHGDVLGGRVHAQLYYRDYLTRFRPFDGRPYANYRNIIQSWLESEKYGARLELERTLHEATGLTLLAGFDYTDERTQQPVSIIDSTAYDQSGGLVYRKAGERPWVPLMNPRSVGTFAQFAWRPLTRLDLQAGIRYERARMQIDDFTTLVGDRVIGGRLAYDPVLFNVGAVVHATGSTSLFGSFSQGFSLTDIGLFLRAAPDGFEVGNRTLRAQKVNNVEVGARGAWSALRGSVAGFYNQSDLGTTSAGLGMAVVRAPERVYGVEATLDADPADAITVGGTFTWTEGENDADEDGDFVALNSYRIQPLKVTGYVEHTARSGWTNRLQLLYSGDRERAFRERLNEARVGFGEQPVDRYLVIDFVTSLPVGPGTLRAGVRNLLNRQYYPVVSQLMWNGRNSSHAAAPGASLTLGYAVTY